MAEQLHLYFPAKSPKPEVVVEDERRAQILISSGRVTRGDWGFIRLTLSDGSEWGVSDGALVTRGVMEWVHLLLEEMLRDGKIKPRKEKYRRKRWHQ